MRALLLAAVIASSPAWAVDCPWSKDDVVVYATMTKVVIDDVEYPVRGPANRGRFLSLLQACDEPEAARHFQGWRGSRMATNISAATILGIFYTPVAAVGAGFFKEEMVLDLTGRSENRSGGITGS